MVRPLWRLRGAHAPARPALAPWGCANCPTPVTTPQPHTHPPRTHPPRAVLPALKLDLTQPGAERLELVLIPSPSDAHLEPVFPQWPMRREDVPEDEEGDRFLARVTLLPNPATFVVGDLVWGASAADAPFHLNPEVASRAGAPLPGAKLPDRFSQLASHLLQQRSYYPLYPAASPEAGGGAGVPLEVSRLRGVGMPCSPDVLLLPSRVGTPCARAVGGGTVAVNPGSLARLKSYARIAVFPLPAGVVDGAEAAGATHVSNGATSRVRVDLERLVREE